MGRGFRCTNRRAKHAPWVSHRTLRRAVNASNVQKDACPRALSVPIFGWTASGQAVFGQTIERNPGGANPRRGPRARGEAMS